MSHSYQLTKHPVGSKREFWTLSWPLMLGLISSTLMIFVDRLFLAHYDPLALNAAACAGTAYYMFLVVPMGVAAIAEVLVGRLHGEDKFSEIGSATWQMVWFGILLTPIFVMIGWFGPYVLFAGTGNEANETDFFKILMLFAPAQCSTIALSGFFIGTGNVKIVTISAMLGNVVNIVLDYLMIFGWGVIPEWGVAGAAYATGISQVIQTTFLLGLFLASNSRKAYNTLRFGFNRLYLFEGLRIGAPSGLGHCMEVSAHFLFFRIVMSVGTEQMTIVAMIQSFYILSTFVIEAQSKAASAIVANLLGAGVFGLIDKVMRSSFILHSFYFLLFVGCIYFFPGIFQRIFNSPAHKELLSDPDLSRTFSVALFFMGLFFLLDGLGWILIGFLTAAGDTRYVLYVSTFVHWVAYVLPTLMFVGWGKGGADVAWSIIAFMSCLSFSLYLWRYLSRAWLKQYQQVPSTNVFESA